MSKHASKEAFYQRLQELAEVKKSSIKETRNLGTLIDYKRAADGVAYGIVKEQHHYYIKKAGTKQNPNVADFAYIGGLENIKEYQYNKLSEADKQRNMILRIVNESFNLKPNKTGSKLLREDKASDEIEKASEKVPELDAATDAAAKPEIPAGDSGEAEMAAGLEAEPTDDEAPAPEGGSEEIPTDIPAPEGDEAPTDEPVPAPEDDEEGGEEMPTEPKDDEEMSTDDDVESGPKDEIKSDIGKIGEKIQDRDLSDDKVNAYVSMFLGYFTNYFADMDIETRKELADKILEVTKEKNIEDLQASMPNDPINADDAGIEESDDICMECGGFGRYAESRGYDAQSLMECGVEEISNVISGYANAYNDGQNDGDFKLVALFVNPEILGKLKNEYGHEDYTDKLTPYTNELNECGLEEKQAQIDELWGGMKSLWQGAAGGIKNAATAVKQQYYKGEIDPREKEIGKKAAVLGQEIERLNNVLQKAGKQPVGLASVLQTIANQVSVGKTVDLTNAIAKAQQQQATTTTPQQPAANVQQEPAATAAAPQKKAATPQQATASGYPKIADAGALNKGKGKKVAEGMVDTTNVEVQPNMLYEEDDELEDNNDKINTPEIDKPIDGAGIAPEADNLGGGIMKPDGAGIEIEVTPDKAVKIEMSEAEKKLRKYIRERLEVKTGLRKENLNENKKSETLRKLDKIIDEQLELHGNLLKKK